MTSRIPPITHLQYAILKELVVLTPESVIRQTLKGIYGVKQLRAEFINDLMRSLEKSHLVSSVYNQIIGERYYITTKEGLQACYLTRDFYDHSRLPQDDFKPCRICGH